MYIPVDGSNELLYEILFDEEFLGGLTLRCSQNRAYRLPPSCLVNISYGRRLETEGSTHKHTPGRSPHQYQSPDYNSYASAAASPRYSEGPTLRSSSFFRSRFRFSSAAGSDFTNSPPSQQQQGYDATDAYSSYYDRRYANHTPNSSPYAYGQRSMDLVTESSRTPRSGHRGGRGRGEFSPSPASRGRNGFTPSSGGRGRGEFSQNQLPPRLAYSGNSSTRGRRHHDDSKPQLVTPVLIQRRREGAGKEIEDRTTAKQTLRQPRHVVEKTPSSAIDRENRDDFSAALQALPKMTPAYESTPASGGSTVQGVASLQVNDQDSSKVPDKKQPRGKAGSDQSVEKEKRPSPEKRDRKRELSPSVAAMFEAVSANQQLSSDVISDDTDASEDNPSTALKTILNIQGRFNFISEP